MARPALASRVVEPALDPYAELWVLGLSWKWGLQS